MVFTLLRRAERSDGRLLYEGARCARRKLFGKRMPQCLPPMGPAGPGDGADFSPDTPEVGAILFPGLPVH